MNLNHPAIEVGPLTAADLDRATNTGRIYMHPPMLPAGCDQSGRYLTRQWGRATLDACAVEGGTHADPAPALSPAVGARIGAAILTISAIGVVALCSTVIVVMLRSAT